MWHCAAAFLMDMLTLFGFFAVAAMFVSYALEDRSHWHILAFAGSCLLASLYGFLQGRGPLESWRPSGPVLRSIVGDLGHFQSRLADTNHAGLERQFCRPEVVAADHFRQSQLSQHDDVGSGSPADRFRRLGPHPRVLPPSYLYVVIKWSNRNVIRLRAQFLR